ncbi:hypothetical protein [Fibrella aquatica]|uniref:hypothetical protein n=1 Tax=Fibrella aquatica TaxID=3242487 RepID=UPI0035203869
MLLRKILFWVAWIPLLPIVWIKIGGLVRNFDMVSMKVGLVRQAVWEKVVLRKVEKRESLQQYKNPTRF